MWQRRVTNPRVPLQTLSRVEIPASHHVAEHSQGHRREADGAEVGTPLGRSFLGTNFARPEFLETREVGMRGRYSRESSEDSGGGLETGSEDEGTEGVSEDEEG
jgi:hypothetical protein